MSDHSHDGEHTGAHHPPSYYVKIWAALVVLLIISILGPEMGILWVTLVTAFGIAVVKALMVAAYFMHLNIEPRFIRQLMWVMLLFMGLFFFGVAPDVLKNEGDNWVHLEGEHPPPLDYHHGDDHGDGHGDGHADDEHGDDGHGDDAAH